MSRTFRRQHHHDAADLKELVWVDSRHGGQFLQWRQLTPGSPDHARARARFHAENDPGVWTAPSWYRRVHNRAHRAHANRALRVLTPSLFQLEGVLLPERARQCGWYWF